MTMMMTRLVFVAVLHCFCFTSGIGSHPQEEHVNGGYATSAVAVPVAVGTATSSAPRGGPIRAMTPSTNNADRHDTAQRNTTIAPSNVLLHPLTSLNRLLSAAMIRWQKRHPSEAGATISRASLPRRLRSAVAVQVAPPPPPPPPPRVIAASYTIYNSDTDQPVLTNMGAYPLLHEGNNWTVQQELYLNETGSALNVRFEFYQPVQYVTYYWNGIRRNRTDRFTPHFSGRYTKGDIMPFRPLRFPGHHTLTVRAVATMPNRSDDDDNVTTPAWQDYTIQFHVYQAKEYLERVLINAGIDDEQYLSHPNRSYSFGIDHAIKVGDAQQYNLKHFQTLRKSEYRGGSGGGSSSSSSPSSSLPYDDFPIFYVVTGLRPHALHRVTVGFVETEPDYCRHNNDDINATTTTADDGQQHTTVLLHKSYFIFCNDNLFDHAYNPLQYVPCDTAHLAHGYFPTTEHGTLTVALLSKFHPYETTVALVDIELF